MTFTVNIVGSGAIGGICAYGAQNQNYSYRMFPRTKDRGITTVESYQGKQVTLNFQRDYALSLTHKDLLILPLKVHDLTSALAGWQSKISTNTPVVLLHNGMGAIEIAATLIPHNPVFIATTGHGAYKPTPNTVKHAGLGGTMLGVSPRHSAGSSDLKSEVSAVLNHLVGPVTWRDDIVLALWQKLAINCAINPLTAIHKLRNGQLSGEQFSQTISGVCAEVTSVANNNGIALKAAELELLVYQVITNTAENYSSMYQDIAHNRQTEIGAINGYIVKLARKKGIDVPINTFLTNQIMDLS